MQEVVSKGSQNVSSTLKSKKGEMMQVEMYVVVKYSVSLYRGVSVTVESEGLYNPLYVVALHWL